MSISNNKSKLSIYNPQNYTKKVKLPTEGELNYLTDPNHNIY